MAIFSTQEMLRRHKAFTKELQDNQIDAAFVYSSDQAYYLSGVPLLMEAGRPMWALFRADGSAMLAGADMEKENMEAYSWITDIRTFSDNESSIDSIISLALCFLKETTAPIRRIGIEKNIIGANAYDSLKTAFPDVEFIEINPYIGKLRLYKSPEEKELLRLCGIVSQAGAKAFVDCLREDITEMEVSAEAVLTMNQKMAEIYPHDKLAISSTFALCQSNLHTLTPHLNPSTRRIQEGDLISLNVFATIWGYVAPIERSFVFGEPKSEYKRPLEAAYAASLAGRQALRPGTAFCDVHKATKDVFKDYGYGEEYFRHGSGHNLGTMIGPGARVDDGELRSYNHNIIKPDTALTMEPGIYIPGVGGFRHCDSMQITETAAICLTDFQY